MTMLISPGRALSGIVLAALFVLATPVGFAAVSDQQLFEAGKQALEQGNYIDASMYLFAYQQRFPPTVQQNAMHARQVDDAIKVSRSQLQSVLARERALEQENRDLHARLGEPVANVSGLTFRPRLDPPGPPSEPSYPMVCRGGGGMRFNVLGEGYGLSGTMVVLEFRRAGGAGPGSLAPGECTWLDRTIDSAEPNRICDLVESTRLHIEWATDGTLRGLGSRSTPYLPRLVTGDDVLTFRVFNNRQGCMIATATPANFGRGRGRGFIAN